MKTLRHPTKRTNEGAVQNTSYRPVWSPLHAVVEQEQRRRLEAGAGGPLPELLVPVVNRALGERRMCICM